MCLKCSGSVLDNLSSRQDPGSMNPKEKFVMKHRTHGIALVVALLSSLLLSTASMLAQGRHTQTAVDPQATSGKWAATNSMYYARSGHTANLLSSGMVLVAGGENAAGNVAQSELYNPTTGSWSLTGSLNDARAAASAVVLPGGKVLVAGGCVSDCANATNTAEIYNPSTSKWSPTGSMISARLYFTATVLKTGKVLVAGGGGDSESICELYNPTTNT